MDESDFPSALNFLPADTFREVLEQKPPSADAIKVAFPLQTDSQLLHELATVDHYKLFKARPPPPSVPYAQLTATQKWAVELGTDDKHKVLYLCGKAGCGKTEVALHICDRLRGRIQAGAGTGKG